MAELQKNADLLLDAFVASWKDLEPTALSVGEIANDLDGRSPPVPNIGQVNAMLKHVNPRKATGVDGVPAWNWHQLYMTSYQLQACSSQPGTQG